MKYLLLVLLLLTSLVQAQGMSIHALNAVTYSRINFPLTKRIEFSSDAKENVYCGFTAGKLIMYNNTYIDIMCPVIPTGTCIVANQFVCNE